MKTPADICFDLEAACEKRDIERAQFETLAKKSKPTKNDRDAMRKATSNARFWEGYILALQSVLK